MGASCGRATATGKKQSTPPHIHLYRHLHVPFASQVGERGEHADSLGAYKASWSKIILAVLGSTSAFLSLPKSGSKGNVPLREAATAGPCMLPSLCDIMTSRSVPQAWKSPSTSLPTLDDVNVCKACLLHSVRRERQRLASALKRQR